MEPVKQIKAVAHTYLQEQQLREQAEYIAVLENTIQVIAEELGIPPQQLINEINVMGRAASAFKDARASGSGVLGAGMAAVKAGAGAVGANMRQAGGPRTGFGTPLNIPTAGARMAGVAKTAGVDVKVGRNRMAGAEKIASRALGREAMGVGNSEYNTNAGEIQNAAELHASGKKMHDAGFRTRDRLFALDKKVNPAPGTPGGAPGARSKNDQRISQAFRRGIDAIQPGQM